MTPASISLERRPVCDNRGAECAHSRYERTCVVASTATESAARRRAPSSGDCISGRYVIERMLGSGGTAVVVAAWDLELEVRVALKIPVEHVRADPCALARLAREAQIARRLQTSHVAQLLDVALDEDAPILVFEHLEGADLADVLTAREALPVDEALAYTET
jgi:serine/threonine protein kinase